MENNKVLSDRVKLKVNNSWKLPAMHLACLSGLGNKSSSSQEVNRIFFKQGPQ